MQYKMIEEIKSCIKTNTSAIIRIFLKRYLKTLKKWSDLDLYRSYNFNIMRMNNDISQIIIFLS